MRIGIGAILGVLGGPATYARELIRALARIDCWNEYVVITDAPEVVGVTAANVRCVRAPLPAAVLQPLWDHAWVPYFIRRFGLHLYHGTKGMLPWWRGCREVVTVHDLAVYHLPETFAWLQRLHQRSHTPFAVRRAVRVITDSEAARRDVLQRFAVSPDRVIAIPLGVGRQFSSEASPDDGRIAEQLVLPPRYMLYAGTIQPRKHVEVLVSAFSQACNRNGAHLLIAGRVRPGYQPEFIRQPPPRVRYMGPVSDTELAVLYRRALALCSPSGYEGFGLSLLEAMASGCLVIAGRNSAVPELVGDGGILLDDLSVPALRAVLEQVLSNDQAFDALRIRARRRAGQFSWEETAHKTLEVYREAAGETRAAA
jgi:glycosyltransferase involved in cell wall biosynthesis